MSRMLSFLKLDVPPADQKEGKSCETGAEKVRLEGLTEVFVPKKPAFDIVLIHSLGGSARETWTTVGASAKEQLCYDLPYRDDAGPAEYWPAQPKVDTDPAGRILVFGYSSNVSIFVSGDTQLSSFLGHAQHLAKELSRFRQDAPRRPLVFIGHGLGGYLIKECLRLCRTGNDLSLQSISNSTRSIVFLCCPQVDGKANTIIDGVEKLLKMDAIANADSLLDDLKENIAIIRQLHTNFMAFIDYRGPLLRVWTVQESRSTRNGSKVVNKPTLLSNDLLLIRHRYTKFITGEVRYRALPKMQYHQDWSVDEACVDIQSFIKRMAPDGRDLSIRTFLAFRPNHPLVHRKAEVDHIFHILTKGRDATKLAIVGPQGSGKTHLAFEVCDQLSKKTDLSARSSVMTKSVFWLDANSLAHVEEGLKSHASMIGLPTTDSDIFLIVMDWLRSDYSGDWVLVFDNVEDRAVFLKPFVRRSPLPHTPTKIKLLDILPSKPGCSIVFLSSDKECTNSILEFAQDRIVKLSLEPLSIDAGVDILESAVLEFGQTTTSLSQAQRQRLAKLFFGNPLSLLQSSRQTMAGKISIADLENASVSLSREDIINLPTKMAIARIKQHDSRELEFLACLAMLDIHSIPLALIKDFPDYKQSALDNLLVEGLVYKLRIDEYEKDNSYVRMPQQIYSVVRSTFAQSQWASLVRKTTSKLGQAFILQTTSIADFFKAAKAFAKALDSVREDTPPVSFVKDELDAWSVKFMVNGSRTKLHDEIKKVFSNIIEGDLSMLHQMVEYVDRRKSGPGMLGSLPAFWYLGADRTALRYVYD